jgi:hypothetical protein
VCVCVCVCVCECELHGGDGAQQEHRSTGAEEQKHGTHTHLRGGTSMAVDSLDVGDKDWGKWTMPWTWGHGLGVGTRTGARGHGLDVGTWLGHGDMA